MSLFDSAISFNYQRRETQVPCCLKCFSLLFLTSYYNPSSHEQQQLYIRSLTNLKNKTLLLSLVKKNPKKPKHSLWPACATAWGAEPMVCSSSQHRARCSCPPRCQTARATLSVASAAAQTISCWQSGRQPVKRWALYPLQLSAVSECRGLSSVKEAVNDSCGDGRLSVPPRLPVVCLYFQAEEQRFAVIGK